MATFHTLAKTKMRARPGEHEPQLRQDIEAHVMSVADGIVVSTDEERQDVIRHYDAPPRNIHVIPAGVNLDTFQPVDQADARAELGIREERVILYVGRIEPLKGIDILLRAVPMMEYGQDLRVLVVGGNPSNDAELDRLKTLTSELGIGDSVTFTGSVPQGVLPTYYSAADVFVLPSHSESFGLAPLEAMACGTPGGSVQGRRHEDVREQRREWLPGAVAVSGVVRAAAGRFACQPGAQGRDGAGGAPKGAKHGLGQRRRPDAGLLLHPHRPRFLGRSRRGLRG